MHDQEQRRKAVLMRWGFIEVKYGGFTFMLKREHLAREDLQAPSKVPVYMFPCSSKKG